MGLFGKIRKTTGWISVTPQSDGVLAVAVERALDGQPKVRHAVLHSLAKSSLETVLERLAKELHVERHACTTLLAADEYQLLLVDAPNVPADELKTAIRWRLKDMLDFHVDDATIDVLDVPPDQAAPARNHSMYVVAARNQVIADRQALFTTAKIPLSVIDVPEMAQRNVSALLEPPGRGVALLSFGPEGGLLTVTFNGELYLSRRMDVHIEQLLDGDAGQQNACRERITLELQRSLDHLDRQYHFITLGKLVLAPMGSAGSILRDYLAANLYLPVETLDLTQIFDCSAVSELRQVDVQQRYFLALGAALRLEERAL
ncbi:MAG: pilus assembly protein PilM [Herbaspirillum sp.]